MKTGLVLEGGGVRGIYTAGVLDVFMERGLDFDGVIGVSAGAIHGVSYLSGQMGRSIRYYRKYLKDPRFFSLQSWIRTGDIAGADFCYRELPEKLDVYDNEAFMKRQTPFYAVLTNVITGKPEYIRLTDMNAQIDYIRASASLPYFSKIVEVNGAKYLDGGVSDAIPICTFRSMGYEKNVVVLTREKGYRKQAGSAFPPKLCYSAYPRFRDALIGRHEAYNRALDEIDSLKQTGSVFVIQPDTPLRVKRLEKNVNRMNEAYERGRNDALRLMEPLLHWL